MANESPTGAAQVPRHRTDELLARLAEGVGARFDASSVFGAPVERDGVTVIPVAAIRFGVGGGGGSDPGKGQDGEGGGAGGTASPAGYIELKDGRSRFVPVVHPARLLLLIGLISLAGLTLGLIIEERARQAKQSGSRLPWR
jgi:uncharacterized spore protein YtfJ